MDAISRAIGNTPLVELTSFSQACGARLYAKLEFYNPTGSVKDRIARYMLTKAIRDKRLKPGMTIVESTSGNTGIALASAARRFGYRVQICMPDTASKERQRLIRALGAELLLTPAAQGQDGAIQLSLELGERDGYMRLGQFDNDDNPAAHYETTAVEILRQMPDLDTFVAGVGTGGTVCGVARRFRDEGRKVRMVGVESAPDSIVQGLHWNGRMVPPVFDESLLDEFLIANDNEAVAFCRQIARQEGLLVGLSSAAVLAEMMRQAAKGAKRVVGIFADDVMKYLSLGALGDDAGPACSGEAGDCRS